MTTAGDEHNAEARWALGGDGAFELQTGEAMLARMWLHVAVPTTSARVVTSSAQWDVILKGFVVRRLTVHEAETPDGPALLEARPDWRHRWSFITPGRDTLRWRPAGLTTPDWACEGKNGQVLSRIVMARGTADYAAEVYVAEAARDLAELPLVLAIGWFLMLLYQADRGGGEG